MVRVLLTTPAQLSAKKGTEVNTIFFGCVAIIVTVMIVKELNKFLERLRVERVAQWRKVAYGVLAATPRKGNRIFLGIPILMKNGTKFRLSVQANDGAYSTPRTREFDSLVDYRAVEIALIDADGEFAQPSVFGLDLADCEYDDVLAYICTQEVITALGLLLANGARIDWDSTAGEAINARLARE